MHKDIILQAFRTHRSHILSTEYSKECYIYYLGVMPVPEVLPPEVQEVVQLNSQRDARDDAKRHLPTALTVNRSKVWTAAARAPAAAGAQQYPRLARSWQPR